MKMIKVEDFNLSADYDNGHVSNELVIALRIDDETAAELKNVCSDVKPLLRDADIASNSMQCGTPKHSLCCTCRNRLNCRLSDECGGCFEYERQSNPLDEIVAETRSLNPIEEEKSMESAERIEITFKSGETISYDKDKWDDYAYDGKAVIVKKNSAWIGIYNFDDVFCVELK